MPFTIYPFELKEPDKDLLKNPLKSKFFKSLPSSLQDRAGADLHLLHYLHGLPVDEIGAPGFTEDLSSNDGEQDQLNIIYPTLNGLYTHILSDPEKVRDFYIGIEPQFEHPDLGDLMEEVEGLLLDFSDMFVSVRTDEDLRDALAAALSERLRAAADLEDQLDVLRQYRSAQTFRIAQAELDGELPLMRVSDRLSDLAQAAPYRAKDRALRWSRNGRCAAKEAVGAGGRRVVRHPRSSGSLSYWCFGLRGCGRNVSGYRPWVGGRVGLLR